MRKWNVYSKRADKSGHMRHSRTLVRTVAFCYRWAAAILKTGAIIRQWKMASCVLLSLIWSLCMSTNPTTISIQYSSHVSNLFCLYNKMKYFPTAIQWFLFHMVLYCFCHEKTPNLRGWGYLNYLHQLSQTDVISVFQEVHYPALALGGGHFLSYRPPSWFVPGAKQHINLMCPGLTRYTSTEKDACSHLCNHSSRSRGHMSPVSHFRANLSFHSPSLHIKQHKWLNLHDRICNMANQVSASIKHYTSTLS